MIQFCNESVMDRHNNGSSNKEGSKDALQSLNTLHSYLSLSRQNYNLVNEICIM